MNYIEIDINFSAVEPWRDIVIASLADKGAESFENTKTGCKAYVPISNFTSIANLELNKFSDHIVSISHQEIEDENWNAQWESNFEPVFVKTDLAILAPFHKQDTKHPLKIIIQPQMSFGTGHHQTTFLISERLLSFNLSGNAVLDMGTGTGVLAILAEKMGAASVFAPDIDEWAYKNALDNAALNNSKNVEWALGGAELLTDQSFDLIIANINKNILIQQFQDYSRVAKLGATLLISGFFITDIDALREEAIKSGFIFENSYGKDEWALVEFIKQ